jgi:two-component system, NarL family, response regulator DevR
MDTAAQLTTAVYIVEDSEAIRTRLVEMLGMVPSARVVGHAATASDAIAGIVATQPDVAVVDLFLSEGTGVEVLRAVRSQLPAALLIVLTNHPTAAHRAACVEAGADYFMDKSAEFLRVNEIVASLTNSPPGRANTTTERYRR